MKSILMASDLSARSDRALQRAVSLAHDYSARLTVVHVVDDSLPEQIVERHVLEASDVLREQIASLPLAARAEIETRIVRGHDYREILALAEANEIDLIVLGSHRHDTREAFRGTTTERVIRFGQFAVLVVKDVVIGPYRRALVAFDPSVHARAAMHQAARLVPGGLLHVLHAVDMPFTAFVDRQAQQQYVLSEQSRFSELVEQDLTELRDDLGEAMPSVQINALAGEIRTIIRQEVERTKPDLLAVGTHGRSGIAHAVLGSVAEDLFADAPIDVLAVKAVPD